jgi:tetratricopeptide (TPR) repeat protein
MISSQGAAARNSAEARSSTGWNGQPPRSFQIDAPPIPSAANRLHWKTLSLAPSVTVSGILEWLALGALFFLILLYPFGLVGEREPEQRFYRAVVLSAMTVAGLVASIGLLERAWWNGKLLWFYVPDDWGGPLIMNSPRASGPFVDPDHFANYLAMVLPVSLAATIFPIGIVDRDKQSNLRLFAGLISLTIVAGILLSFSRAGWAATAAGVAVALILGARHVPGFTPTALRISRQWMVAILIAAFVVGLGAVLFAAGPIGRTQMAIRLISLMAGGDDVRFRPTVWVDTLKLIKDFPIFGVGLGAWPDVLPHYQRAPWMPFFFRQTENDYLQYIAETGLCGALLLAWLGSQIVHCLRGGAKLLPERDWSLFAGLIGAIVAALIHEGFDFALHTPANALIFVMLLALALRIAITNGMEAAAPRIRPAPKSSRSTYVAALLGGVSALGLIVAAYAQNGSAYPYGVPVETNLRQAEANLIDHPAMSGAHLVLTQLIGLKAPPEIRLAMLRAAVWLDPNDPTARDRYAQALLLAGEQSAGLGQVTISVFRAPRLEAHQYLASPLIPWLLPDEQTAIKNGFDQAVAAGFEGAIEEFAAFYRELGRYRDIGDLYARAANATNDPVQRQDDLVEAGRNYGLVGDQPDAIANLRAAAAIDPTDPRPYAESARSVFGPSGQLLAAESTIQQGLRAGADPVPLYVALADADEQAGNRTAEEAALEEAVRVGGSFDVAMRLGELYLGASQFNSAVRVLSRAATTNPDSAAVWFALGQGHEGDYDYYSAGHDYARARSLEPANHYYASVYTEFMRRTAAASKP